MSNYTYMDCDELVALMDNSEKSAKLAIIDCREHERESGFIVGSIHAPSSSYTTEMYQQLARTLWDEKKEIAVFHCTFSEVRGPRGANRLALAQKELGLSYPLVYVLRGGFDRFFDMYGNTRIDLMYV